MRFRATLRGAESFIDRHPHPIVAPGQDDGRASDKEPDRLVQAVNDGEVRGRVVRREDIRTADHRERRVLIEFAGLDRVGQLNGSDDALDARLFGILGKNDALDLRSEWRRWTFRIEADPSSTCDGKNALSKTMLNLRSAGQSCARSKVSLRSLIHFHVPLTDGSSRTCSSSACANLPAARPIH